MRRREFIALLGSGVTGWPLAARAQRPNVMRRVGVLTGAFGPDSQARVAVFLQALAQLGWMEGQNVRLETRCRLYLQSCPIQLARCSLKACRGQAAMPPVSSNSNTA